MISKKQVITEVQGSKYGFTIQLVESINMSNYTQLLVLVHYATKDATRTELLLINEMRTTGNGEDVFELVDNFFRKKWFPMTKLVGCTTDGTPAMLGRKSWFQARVKAVCHFRSVCHFRLLLLTPICSRC